MGGDAVVAQVLAECSGASQAPGNSLISSVIRTHTPTPTT
eukprot:COSAG01_NODE_49229_length_374_cov_0.567273_2_plen_39_part_01